ncbi:sodium/proton antiporter, NhaA family [Mucilaginibacter sp. OK268]|uniref:Na+/H+ antiporter NhaA n=1 Tax=Mucilaginibacter sp. OK268 TaxID=1881048 RepID=UPI0008921AFD|nr:Na+/H+ antiporter NhaA [Mucilaginibacter sp. OK268]SDP18891.1 sodium/proton antiporter, NhaA family [Mucilaginibacter sp. OK268]
MRQKTPIEKITAPVNKFIHQEHTSGIVLFISVVVAIIWVNSPLEHFYHYLWDLKFSLGFGGHVLDHSLHLWINDGLMAIFFFVIGLELKREFMAGELSSIKKASLPMVAALGGMLVPALIYFFINKGTASEHGWGIPMATDIAFALALLSIAGKHIPSSVKVFLSALAVADDLGAVLVIAIFYSSHIALMPLTIGVWLLVILLIGNKMGIRNITFYLVIGFGVWVAFLLSGVHATIAGVLVAFTIPARTRINEKSYADNLRQLLLDFEKAIPNNSTLTTPEQHDTIEKIKELSMDAETPLQKVEFMLHPWVAFVVMPLFALANAGIVIGANFFSSLANPVSLGVTIGLLAGKFIGVLLATWLMVKLGAQLPAKSTWKQIVGVALLAGVGFTMSLFISGLAFSHPEMVDQAKYGILLASLLSGVLGVLVLRKA